MFLMQNVTSYFLVMGKPVHDKLWLPQFSDLKSLQLYLYGKSESGITNF